MALLKKSRSRSKLAEGLVSASARYNRTLGSEITISICGDDTPRGMATTYDLSMSVDEAKSLVASLTNRIMRVQELEVEHG